MTTTKGGIKELMNQMTPYDFADYCGSPDTCSDEPSFSDIRNRSAFPCNGDLAVCPMCGDMSCEAHFNDHLDRCRAEMLRGDYQ